MISDRMTSLRPAMRDFHRRQGYGGQAVAGKKSAQFCVIGG
jgi:hypothetical protein